MTPQRCSWLGPFEEPTMTLTCPHCGRCPDRWLPVEPFWGLPAVADLLQTTPGYLRKWLCTDSYLVAGAQLGSLANLGAEGLKLPEKYGAFIVTANLREHRQTRRHPHEHLLFWARRPHAVCTR
jgi:hypothetical protein